MGLTILLFGAANGILGPLLPAIEREFGIHARESGLLFSFTFAGAIIAIMTGGYLADCFGKKRLFLIVLAGLILAYVGFFAAPTFALVAASCLVAGALGAAMEGLCSAVVADLDSLHLARNMTLLQVTFCAGALAAVAAASFLRGQEVSWRALYGLFALCAIAILFLSLRMDVPPAPPGEPIHLKIAWRLLEDTGLLRLALAICLYVSAEMSLAWLISPILQGACGYSEPVAMWGAGVFWGTMGVTRVGVAFLCGRISNEFLLRLLVCGGLLAFGFLLLPVGPWHFWAGIVISGATFSGIWPLLVSLANARHPSYSGTVTALMVTSGTLGGLVGPYLAVQLLEGSPSAGKSLFFMAGSFAALAFVVLPLRSARGFDPIQLPSQCP